MESAQSTHSHPHNVADIITCVTLRVAFVFWMEGGIMPEALKFTACGTEVFQWAGPGADLAAAGNASRRVPGVPIGSTELLLSIGTLGTRRDAFPATVTTAPWPGGGAEAAVQNILR